MKVRNKVTYTKLCGSTKGQKAKVPVKCKSMNISLWREKGKNNARKRRTKQKSNINK